MSNALRLLHGFGTHMLTTMNLTSEVTSRNSDQLVWSAAGQGTLNAEAGGYLKGYHLKSMVLPPQDLVLSFEY